MLAQLQRLITLGLLAALVCWVVFFHARSPVTALVGAAVLVGGHALVLGLEFALMRRVNRSDQVPQATLREVVQAWWCESLLAPRVFFWRQPFRSLAIPDSLPCAVAEPRRGLVLVHGFFCNRGFWMPWLKRLQAGGHPFVALSLEPVFGSIDDYVPQIEHAVGELMRTTDLPPVIVCHSMGGLAVRAWLAKARGDGRVHHIVTIGTPHRGTWLARFSHSENGRQMRLSSDWRALLERNTVPSRPGLFTCWYSQCDNIVFPASSATLPGADNRLVRGAAHVELAFVPEVLEATLALLDAPA